MSEASREETPLLKGLPACGSSVMALETTTPPGAVTTLGGRHQSLFVNAPALELRIVGPWNSGHTFSFT